MSSLRNDCARLLADRRSFGLQDWRRRRSPQTIGGARGLCRATSTKLPGDFCAIRRQTSHGAQLRERLPKQRRLRHEPREPATAHHDRQGDTMTFHRHARPQRPPARLHELPGGALPRRLAGDDPPLDRRRPPQLLPHARRPAALLARAARRVHHLDAPRAGVRATHAERGAPPDSARAPPAAQLARRPNFSRRRR